MNLNSNLLAPSVKLGELAPGDVAQIQGFCLGEEGSDDSKLWQERFLHRLHEIGFLVGERVELLNQAPFSQNPISVRIKGAVYAIRREDANCVLVKRITS